MIEKVEKMSQEESSKLDRATNVNDKLANIPYRRGVIAAALYDETIRKSLRANWNNLYSEFEKTRLTVAQEKPLNGASMNFGSCTKFEKALEKSKRFFEPKAGM